MEFNDILLKAISWTLVHSVWQGFVLALLAGIVILLTRKSAAAIRYNLLSALLVLFVMAASATFNYEYQDKDVEVVTRFNLPEVVANSEMGSVIKINSTSAISDVIINFLNANANWIVMLWFLIFAIKVFGICSSFSQIYRIRNYRTLQAPDHWSQRLLELSRRIGLQKQIILLESQIVKVPSVTGFFKPMLLVPVGMFANLPQDEIEAILLHELAHVRRKDYFINILQSLIEIVFFFNPGVLWLSSVLKEERENCCDDIAISATGNKTRFVHALVSFEQYNRNNELVMGFGGNKNHLLNRAKRIIHNNNKSLNAIEKTFLSMSLVVVAIAMIACSNAKMGNGENNPVTAAQIREADREAMNADRKAQQSDLEVKKADALAEAASETAKKADASAKAADIAAHQADIDAAKADAAAKTYSRTVRTVNSQTRTDHSIESETTSYDSRYPVSNNRNVSIRTGVSGENLPDNINVDQLTSNIISDLVAENIIITTANLSYKLSDNNLIVNGVVQPDNKFRKVKEKYMQPNMHAICYNYEISNKVCTGK